MKELQMTVLQESRNQSPLGWEIAKKDHFSKGKDNSVWINYLLYNCYSTETESEEIWRQNFWSHLREGSLEWDNFKAFLQQVLFKQSSNTRGHVSPDYMAGKYCEWSRMIITKHSKGPAFYLEYLKIVHNDRKWNPPDSTESKHGWSFLCTSSPGLHYSSV